MQPLLNEIGLIDDFAFWGPARALLLLEGQDLGCCAGGLYSGLRSQRDGLGAGQSAPEC